jgi:hypothetical protein
MDSTILPLLAAGLVTSLATYLGATRVLALSRRRLRDAAAWVLETIGLALALLALNLIVGVAAVLVLRALTGRFVSLYTVSDLAWIGLSWLQALILRRWLDTR